MTTHCRAEAWWSRFCRQPRIEAAGADGRIADRSIEDSGICSVRAVGSAGQIAAGTPFVDRLWHARPSQHVGRNGALIEELCWDGATGWRPWHEFAGDYDSTPLTYRRCRDALLFVRSGLVMPRPMVVYRETRPDWGGMLDPLPGCDRVSDEPPALDLEAAKPGRLIEGQVLSLCHVYGHGYGHWFADAVPPLLNFLPMVREGRLSLAVSRLFPWQRRTLDLLGVPSRAIMEIAKPTAACRDLICHSFAGRSHAVRSSGLTAEVYRRLVARRPAVAEAPRLIYVSRSSLGSWRDFANEQQIESAFEKLGFVVLHPQAMTLDQQMAAFARAEVIAGPHGSAHANAGFAPPGCLIVAIVPHGLSHHWIYGIARHLGHRLVILIAAHDDADGAEPEFFRPMSYRICAHEVTERTRAAMRQLAIGPSP